MKTRNCTLSCFLLCGLIRSGYAQQCSQPVLVASGFQAIEQVGETLTGVTDGVNLAFVASHAPLTGRDHAVVINGQLISDAAYSVSGSTFVFATGSAPPKGAVVKAMYYWSSPASPVVSLGGPYEATLSPSEALIRAAGRGALLAETAAYNRQAKMPATSSNVSGVEGLGDMPMIGNGIPLGQSAQTPLLREPSSVRMLKRSIAEGDESGDLQADNDSQKPSKKKSVINLIWR